LNEEKLNSLESNYKCVIDQVNCSKLTVKIDELKKVLKYQPKHRSLVPKAHLGTILVFDDFLSTNAMMPNYFKITFCIIQMLFIKDLTILHILNMMHLLYTATW